MGPARQGVAGRLARTFAYVRHIYDYRVLSLAVQVLFPASVHSLAAGVRVRCVRPAMSRFREPQHPDFQRLNASLLFDRRLWPQDVAQSRAHARMLAARGILSERDRDALLGGLDAVEAELAAERFPFHEDDEDIHMAIERRLTEIVGPVGGRLHTARSRNDQVATDVAMYTRERALSAQVEIGVLMGALLRRAEEHVDWPLPGYTHLQRAQPVYLGHHLLAYFWMLRRDRERFAFSERQAARLPLGAGALAGVSFDTDRRMVADELGFPEVVANSIDAVSNRDYVLDYLSAAALCATHLSRLGSELVLWSSEEFGFCELPDAWSSGSSIMPQKKNPDAAELLRAKAPRVLARLVAMHGTLHALPLTYNKDMQEDKENLFDAADTLELTLRAARGMVEGARFSRERMRAAAADEQLGATDVADMLVRHGLPFREAHGVVAGLVRTALEDGRTLSRLTSAELSRHSELLGEHASEYFQTLRQDSWLESKVSEGGTALVRVREQLELAREVLGEDSPG
jgi:argininosuccinate lyase